MVTMLRSLVFAAALACVAALPMASSAASQPQGGMVEPTPLETDHPRAKQAAALVEQLLAGNRDAVLEILRTEGTAEVARSAAIETTVDTQIARLAHKGYKIDQFMTGRGADVIVELAGANVEDTNIVIRFTPDEPHRIEGFAQAMMAG
jgi:hypothetical protein